MGSDRAATLRVVVRYAAVGAVLVLVVVWVDMQSRGNGNPVSLLQPGAAGPSAAVIERDFPDLELPAGIGHDGQQFYAVARDPFPLDRSAPHLDRPQYRMQRPLFPMLAWALHPQGGGVGLVVALLVVSLAGVVAGGVGLGILVTRAGGPAWSALLFAAIPGSFVSLRITTADALAMGLCLAAVAALDARRPWLSVPLAVAAVLAREPTILVLGAVALARRDRRAMVMAGAAGVAALVWALVVRATVPATGEQVVEFVAPLSGWWDAARDWVKGEDLAAAGICLVTVIAAVAAVVRRPRGPWTIAIAVQLAFLAVLGTSVVGLDYNAARTMMPLLAIAVVALLQRDEVIPSVR